MALDDTKTLTSVITDMFKAAQDLLNRYNNLIKEVKFPDKFVKITAGTNFPEDMLDYLSAIEFFLNAPEIADYFEDHAQRREFRERLRREAPRLHRLFESNRLRGNHLNLINLSYIHPEVFSVSVANDIAKKMESPEISAETKAEDLYKYLLKLLGEMEKNGYVSTKYFSVPDIMR